MTSTSIGCDYAPYSIDTRPCTTVGVGVVMSQVTLWSRDTTHSPGWAVGAACLSLGALECVGHLTPPMEAAASYVSGVQGG